ncbi:TIGR03668 family PPOX class F420-dependent oxidoreductase [Saccharomonospora halophila]|uniref:TIGR03668 family PPOX class F420-dependent oxidoreductase n=1 Tax=Saccharomonospora halophila TaxID=129922 RepID=UPI000372812C|nr:TIGR03668 family PPOX class F420-dependent oxidoreductase [Saccharomonospora halophila]
MRMDPARARARFAAARVARLATVGADDLPHLVPVTFALDTGTTDPPDDLVTAVDSKPKRTTSLRRLRNIAAHPGVSLLVDHYDDTDWTRLWWVRADGLATVADTDPAAAAALSAKYPQYRHEPPRGPFIRIAVTTWRGWAASAPDPSH